MVQVSLFPDKPATGYIVQGKYRLERKLSEGGGGQVWEAYDPAGNLIALKFLKWSPSKSRVEVADRFKNEFAILKNLFHPNIAQIFDFGLDAQSGLYFFTTELLTAGDLLRFIGAPVPVLEDMLLQALRSLEYLRGHKLLHLDIKPHNLLLRQEKDHETLALIDFGLATFRPPDRPGGTPNYMAPELIVMRLSETTNVAYPPPDHRSDLYSLGVTFYHCLTGVQPFCVKDSHGRIDVMATLKKHLEYDPPPPSAHRPEIPAYLDRIIMKLMARHPDDRYPSAIVAAQALQYSSPRKRAPECLQTLLAYLPKEGKLIGRRCEYALIEESMRAIAKATPRVAPIVCVAGGRGCGRTRLLRAAKPLAQQMEMDVSMFGEGDPLTSRALEKLLTEDATKGPPVRAIFIDDLDVMLEHNGNGSGDGSVMEAFAALLRRLKLQQRFPDTPAPRMFLLFTLNTDRVGLSRTMVDLDLDHAVCHIVELLNFSKEDVAEYLNALLGEMPDNSVVDQLMRCTGGNPLFITEHFEQMISQGRLFSLAGRPDADTLKVIGIDFSKATPPKSLAQSVTEKLRGLTPEAQELALLLACWYHPTSILELEETADGENIDRDVLALVSAGLVRRDKDSGYISFVNEMSGRIIRDKSFREHVAASHDAIAKYLKSKRVRKTDDLDIHLAYGSNPIESIPALMRVARQALAGNEPLEAASHLETLYNLINETDWSDRADVLKLLGKAYARAHRDREARAAYQKIASLSAPRILKRKLRAKSAELMGLLAMKRRNLRDARRHFDEALAFLEEGRNDAMERVRLQNYMGSIELREGRIEHAVDIFRQTASVAERTLSESERAEITNNELGEALIRAGKTKEAISILSDELERAQMADNAERMTDLHYLLGNALRDDDVRKYAEARLHYNQGLKLAKTHHLIEQNVRILNGLANLNLMLHKPKEAMESYREGLKLAQQVESETTSVEIMIGMGLASQQLAVPDRTIEFFEAALDFSKTPKAASAGLLRRYRPTIYVSLGDAYFQKHDLKHAETYLKKAMEIDRKHPLTPDIRYSLYGTFVEVFLEQGKIEAAKKFMPTVEAIAKAFPQAQKHFQKLSKRFEH